ncbi:MAG: ATPase, T2SS/T4P/T4SS family [Haloarculaceae archaeon]
METPVPGARQWLSAKSSERWPLGALRSNGSTEETNDGCGCTPRFEDERLHVDASACDGGGRLAESVACRATVIDALAARDADAVLVHSDGCERAYEGDARAVLVAAGRFADGVAVHDERLASRACSDPLRAGTDAAGRAGAVGRLAATTGLAEAATRFDGYEDALTPHVGPTVARSRVRLRPPSRGTLRDRRELDTDAVVRVYDRPDAERPIYHLQPVEHRLDASAMATLARARERLATGEAGDGDRAPERAVRAVAADDDPVETLAGALRKHTRGHGVLADCFADATISDVFVTAPVDRNRLRVRVDGEPMATNVRLTAAGADALASRFRRESGRAFSRASPTLDASLSVADRIVRVAGVTDPASDGVGFAFRAQDGAAWTLPGLVANGTLTADAAALLSLAVERGAAILVAGPRGAGKTTLLGALLWELPAAVRTVVVEDTPELPVERLQTAGRDVQALRASVDEPGLTPTEALRSALRLGEGALVVGEVRGEEAAVLYEAMRVGANASAVLGTIHGDGGEDVRERVVSDLGVPASSFAVTDLLVTLETVHADDGTTRRVRAIEEVATTDTDVGFATLFDREDDELARSGRLGRGDSRAAADLVVPDGSYAAVREALADRSAWLARLAANGRTGSDAVVRAHARRRNEC